MHLAIDHRSTNNPMPASIKSLLVDADGQRRMLVEELLSNMGYSTVASFASVEQISASVPSVEDNNLLLILYVDALTDSTTQQIQHFLTHRPMPLLMLVEEIDKAQMRKAMKAGVSAFVSLGVKGNRIKQAIDSAFANFAVVCDLQQQITSLKDRLDSRVIIDKAKGLVMKNRGMDEAEAYQYLREYAMKKGKKLIDIAQMTIATAELLDK